MCIAQPTVAEDSRLDMENYVLEIVKLPPPLPPGQPSYFWQRLTDLKQLKQKILLNFNLSHIQNHGCI